jgi:hypothetical protein
MGHGVEERLAVEEDATGDAAGGREQAEKGERGGGFAGAGFAYEAQSLSGGDGEGDSLDYRIDDGVEAEGYRKIFNFEEGGGHCG